MKRIITQRILNDFAAWLGKEEKSRNTIVKYLRDVSAFSFTLGEREVTKEAVISYKQYLTDSGYAVRSVNSSLASLNSLFSFMGWNDCRVKTLKVQRQVFCPKEKELTKAEYERLCQAAGRKHNKRLELILQTICGTGIRVSELRFITVEAVNNGEAQVSLKNLLRYIAEQKIKSGAVFVTVRGNPINRSNIWREMKSLCSEADVEPGKVFPHNLRHLFARVFYGIEKDIAKLADILGHSSINTTRIYIISSGQEHLRHMERMRLII